MAKVMPFFPEEDFFKLVHPLDASGKIFLRRVIKGISNESVLPASQLVTFARYACALDDITFCTSRFLGRNLLLNFVSTNTLLCKLPINDKVYDLCVLMQRLLEKGIPRPTRVFADGRCYTLIWILNEPIRKNEFFKVYLLQNFIYSQLQCLRPLSESVELSTTIPMPGTTVSQRGTVVRESWMRGEVIGKELIENIFLRSICASERLHLQNHSAFLLELLALFFHRSLFISRKPELFEAWVTLLGVSLKNFCSDSQLWIELEQVVVALEGVRWVAAKDRYIPLISALVNGAAMVPSTFETLTNTAHGVLQVTKAEVEACGLYYLAGKYANANRGEPEYSADFCFGSDGLVPYQRILLREAS